jgi:hypothetical protein
MEMSKCKECKLSDYADIQPGDAFKSERFTDDNNDVSCGKKKRLTKSKEAGLAHCF